MINWNKIVVFGAGKISRSFIGQLFSRGGYEVVFIDVFKPVIDELNLKKQYKVIIKSEKEETLLITNVRGVLANDTDEVTDEISTAGILAVSIGQKSLPDAMLLIAMGQQRRYVTESNAPLDIIITENLRNGARFFGNEDENGNMLPEYIQFGEVFNSGISEVLKKVSGFTEASHLQVFNDARIISANIAENQYQKE